MRSRYSAFVTKNTNYLIDTLHSDHRNGNERHELENTIEQTNWLGLKIIRSETDRVEFCAFFQALETVGQLHEISQFKKENGQWHYTSGSILPDIKLSRNDTCFCGSQKKYKKCCMAI